MARNLENITNTTPADNDYPSGRVKDSSSPGAGDGVKNNEILHGDWSQFFAKLLRDSDITPNDLPDNTTNGFQLFQALLSKTCRTLSPTTYATTVASWDCAAYGAGVFVIATSNTLQTSVNGNGWTSQTHTSSTRRIAWSDSLSLFVAVGDNSDVSTSPDGITWTNATLPNSSREFSDIAWSDSLSLFVAVAGDSNRTDNIATSPDGFAWTIRSTPASDTLNAVTFGGGQFVIGADSGKFYTSPDGITWTQRTSPVFGDVSGVTYGVGVYVAVFSTNTGSVYSYDGITWVSAVKKMPFVGSRVKFCKDVFIAISETSPTTLESGIFISTDGNAWHPLQSDDKNTWVDVAYSTEREETIIVSEDGSRQALKIAMY